MFPLPLRFWQIWVDIVKTYLGILYEVTTESSFPLLQWQTQSVDKMPMFTYLCNLSLFIYNAQKMRSPSRGLFLPLKMQQNSITVTISVEMWPFSSPRPQFSLLTLYRTYTCYKLRGSKHRILIWMSFILRLHNFSLLSQTHCLQIGSLVTVSFLSWRKLRKTESLILPGAGHKTYLLLTSPERAHNTFMRQAIVLCPEERKALTSESQGTEECVQLGLAESPSWLLLDATCWQSYFCTTVLSLIYHLGT